ncbi:Proline--tRNA ligase [Escovopsis weberi]|uniref:Proline--tRNA ligase n=1 Tax=Escovopsis weberi TaxID=150374 RepID=A0A0M8N516_ESCWE|nr:Proline--tRNA ligase [Escovopsis weberi]
MKDLYTFDLSVESAIDTYQDVSHTYTAFFADLKLPILVAEASSGDMGGNHSHEYHLANAIGEDIVATCKSCGYTANDEVAASQPLTRADIESVARDLKPSDVGVWRGITKDRKTLVNAWYPLEQGSPDEDALNIHAVKLAVPELDASVSDSIPFWKESLQMSQGHEKGGDAPQLVNVIDSRIAPVFEGLKAQLQLYPDDLDVSGIAHSAVSEDAAGDSLNLVRLMHGDKCPRCGDGSLEIHRALELGHTFILGTRYSEPLEAKVALPQQPARPVPLQMGCFGIGVSRILGTVAEHLSDERGLNWPRAIAPFEVIIIPTSGVNEQTLEFYDGLSSRRDGSACFDVVLDDRKESFGWKMQDADLTGYPVVVVLGKAWRQEGVCEVQCRRLAYKENVRAEDVAECVSRLLKQL